MSDKENKETTEAEDEMIEEENSEEENSEVENSEKENSEKENSEEEPSDVETQPKVDHQDGEGDANKPLSAAEYLNPPERRWVLPTFLGMLVVFCSYYWWTYVNLL
jgi:hypothetical protein